jgi:hypothetical protein
MLYTDGASDHLVLKDSSSKPYCSHLCERRMNRWPAVGSSGAEAPVLARLCLDSNEASYRPTVSSLRLSDHPVLLTLLLLLCNSSDTSRNRTIGSFDGVIFILPTTQCTKCTNACTDGTVGSSNGGFFLFSRVVDLFLCFFDCGCIHGT